LGQVLSKKGTCMRESGLLRVNALKRKYVYGEAVHIAQTFSLVMGGDHGSLKLEFAQFRG
jgi:hypothetical protein